MKAASLLLVLFSVNAHAQATALITKAPTSFTVAVDTWYTLKPQTVVLDTASGYNSSTGQYQAPEEGLYEVKAKISLYGSKSANNGFLIRVRKCLAPSYVTCGSIDYTSNYNRLQGSTTNDPNYFNLNEDVLLNEDDRIEIEFYTSVSGNTISTSQPSTFQVHLVK